MVLFFVLSLPSSHVDSRPKRQHTASFVGFPPPPLCPYHLHRARRGRGQRLKRGRSTRQLTLAARRVGCVAIRAGQIEGKQGMKIAGVQMDVTIGQVDANLEKMAAFLRRTTRDGAVLTVFPECAATGYCFNDLAEARSVASTVPGPVTDAMTRACKSVDSFAVFGM